ncbi:MAG: M28 family peptidase [Bacteroidales bacterium]|nr:M28 family peptidase [Bacteroidales bacterium]MCF8405591.1 M28 family peptidase [Bacteroidales bacterium]
MKYLYITLAFLCLAPVSFAQDFNQNVNDLIQQTNLDTLIKYTRQLTGEDSVLVNGEKVLILNRQYANNEMAAEFLKQKLSEFGLEPIEQVYSSTGKNIFAIQEGAVYPEQQYIICAHYDAVANYCADDDASGCVAVLESARLLSQLDFDYTIVYAFWDEEEVGLIGSAYYAAQANQNNDLINGVLNLEMFGWDSNNDMKIDIHTQNFASSPELADYLAGVNDTYDLLLDPVIYNPGTTASDHSSFWNQGFSAIVFSEAFFGGDSNPYYHTSQDRIDKFNLPYFHELSKLAVGAIASLASPMETTHIFARSRSDSFNLLAYPNPVNKNAHIIFKLENSENIQISLFNSLGQNVDNLLDKQMEAGSYNIPYDCSALQPGIYLLILRSNVHYTSFKITIQ